MAIRDLKEAATNFFGTFIGDQHLLAGHGAKVNTGGPFEEPRPNEYNLFLPSTSDDALRALAESNTLVFGCSDRRIGPNPIRELDADAALLVAGGAAQPDPRRRDEIAKLVSAIYAENPRAQFVFTAHDHKCAGADHYSHGDTGNIYAQHGIEGEQPVMAKLVYDTIQAARDAGVPPEQISAFLINLNNNRYDGLMPLMPPDEPPSNDNGWF